jgi:selenocysteine lyase/cysteine desulfurase
VIFAIDCAAFCCHQELNLEKNNEIDFVYLSPHKNLGGAESCGVLIARKNIVRNAKPTFPGGGTVAFVKGYSKDDVMYDVDIFNR